MTSCCCWFNALITPNSPSTTTGLESGLNWNTISFFCRRIYWYRTSIHGLLSRSDVGCTFISVLGRCHGLPPQGLHWVSQTKKSTAYASVTPLAIRVVCGGCRQCTGTLRNRAWIGGWWGCSIRQERARAYHHKEKQKRHLFKIYTYNPSTVVPSECKQNYRRDPNPSDSVKRVWRRVTTTNTETYFLLNKKSLSISGLQWYFSIFLYSCVLSYCICTEWAKKVIPLVQCNVMYERYRIFWPTLYIMCTSCTISWIISDTDSRVYDLQTG